MAKVKVIPEDELNSYTAGLFQHYVVNGDLDKRKLHEENIAAIKEFWKEKLVKEEEKRHEFKEHGLVMKWVVKPTYMTDTTGLNDYLNDLGLLPLVANIKPEDEDIEEEIKDMLLPETYYIRPTLNKNGKEYITSEGILLGSQSVEELIPFYLKTKSELDKLNEDYSNMVSKMGSCKVLNSKKKVQTTYGSIAKVANKRTYDVAKIYNEFGDHWMIENSKPNSVKLQELIENGQLSQKDINQFRQVIDKRLEFHVLTLESEQKIFDMLNWKRSKAINNGVQVNSRDVRAIHIEKAIELLKEDCCKLPEGKIENLLQFSLIAERATNYLQEQESITGEITYEFTDVVHELLSKEYGIGLYVFKDVSVLYELQESYDVNGQIITDGHFTHFMENNFYHADDTRWTELMRTNAWGKVRNNLPGQQKNNDEQLDLFDEFG